jgi:hypothetical protein
MSGTTSGETTTVTGTRTFVDAMIAHNTAVRAEIEQAAAGLASAGITGPVLDGLHELAGHYDGARGRWDSLGAALKQHEALAEQARATHGAATDMTFYTDDSVKDPMTTSADSTVPAADDTGGGDALPDTAGITNTEHWHASEVLTASNGDGTVCLGLCKYPDSDAYVVVATKPAGQPWDPDNTANGIDPPLSPQEASQLADTLDELVALAQSGAAAPAPTKQAKLAERIRGLLGDNGRVTMVGDAGEIEVSAADLRTLLDAAAPEPALPTRRKVTGKACGKEGFDTGTVWARLDTTGPHPVIAVTSTEGTEQPEDYPDGYTTTRLSLAQAGQLAAKVRRFARHAPTLPATYLQRTRQNLIRRTARPTTTAPAAAASPGAPAQPRRVTNPHGRTYEYDPTSGATAVIEPDGWRAVVPPTSATGLAARLLYWRAEIQDGRGEDATVQAGRELLAGLSAAELRELADSVGTPLANARTKPQMIDAIVTMTIVSPQDFRALREWWF